MKTSTKYFGLAVGL